MSRIFSFLLIVLRAITGWAHVVFAAYEAYQRFGFTDCVLFREPDSLMYTTLISNIKE